MHIICSTRSKSLLFPGYSYMVKRLFTLGLLFGLVTSKAQYTKLLDFSDSANGKYPNGALLSMNGFLYGMTSRGGTSNYGTVFKIQPDGTGYFKLRDFTSISPTTPSGGSLNGSLVSDGTFLYGMTEYGGISGAGTIFRIQPDGAGYGTRFHFMSGSGGSIPNGSLIYNSGVLYGMTTGGGSAGGGTVFRLSTNSTWITKLYDLPPGSTPFGDLVYDSTFLYGATLGGGIYNAGIIFKIKPDGTGFTTLLDLNGTTTGKSVLGSLIYSSPYLYGMTRYGGSSNKGIIFRIKTDGTGFANLFNFDGNTGENPTGTLAFDGNFLYGTTRLGGIYNAGTLFRINPDGTNFTDLFDFGATSNDGKFPGSVILDNACLYGMTNLGGNSGFGTVFQYCLQAVIGIDSLAHKDDKLLVYPNPIEDKLELKYEQTLIPEVVIVTNTLGQEVYFVNTPTTEIDFSNFVKGIYFLTVQTKGQKQVFKIVKD